MVTKVSEVKELVKAGIADPESTFPAILKMATSDDWILREVAATCLVEISKKKPDPVAQEMKSWADSLDPNVRRTSSEGLREIARKTPEKALPILEKLKTDDNLYVKKSVANVLRNAGRKHPYFVFEVCRNWAKSGNKHTNWIVKEGLKKLKETYLNEAKMILASLRNS